jgi:hypothetical protein
MIDTTTAIGEANNVNGVYDPNRASLQLSGYIQSI